MIPFFNLNSLASAERMPWEVGQENTFHLLIINLKPVPVDLPFSKLKNVSFFHFFKTFFKPKQFFKDINKIMTLSQDNAFIREISTQS